MRPSRDIVAVTSTIVLMCSLVELHRARIENRRTKHANDNERNSGAAPQPIRRIGIKLCRFERVWIIESIALLTLSSLAMSTLSLACSHPKCSCLFVQKSLHIICCDCYPLQTLTIHPYTFSTFSNTHLYPSSHINSTPCA